MSTAVSKALAAIRPGRPKADGEAPERPALPRKVYLLAVDVQGDVRDQPSIDVQGRVLHQFCYTAGIEVVQTSGTNLQFMPGETSQDPRFRMHHMNVKRMLAGVKAATVPDVMVMSRWVIPVGLESIAKVWVCDELPAPQPGEAWEGATPTLIRPVEVGTSEPGANTAIARAIQRNYEQRYGDGQRTPHF